MVKEPMYEEEGGCESISSPRGACTGGLVCGECICMLPASGISHAAKMNGAGFICNVNAQTTEEINVPRFTTDLPPQTCRSVGQS